MITLTGIKGSKKNPCCWKREFSQQHIDGEPGRIDLTCCDKYPAIISLQRLPVFVAIMWRDAD
ncbi:hypothetical protein [Acidocella facilis]|uniref:hypothetical protein n=1 Tax=Acidocella facilis TaxID=525 RepID=UPI001F1E4022|nr:hypothetical protein [Acidocella facilis]